MPHTAVLQIHTKIANLTEAEARHVQARERGGGSSTSSTVDLARAARGVGGVETTVFLFFLALVYWRRIFVGDWHEAGGIFILNVS